MEYYKESFVAELDLENLVFKELDVPYPEIYYDTHFGFRDIPTGTIGGDGKLNFTFSISSNLYQYSETEGQVRAFGATSDFTDNMANELPIADCTEASKAMKHNLLNVKYLQLLFDPYKNLYYRFHWGQVPERKNDGKYSAYNDKPLYLGIFDQNLAKIIEREVDNKQGAVWSFVTEKGLYVIKARGREDILGFNLYKTLL